MIFSNHEIPRSIKINPLRKSLTNFQRQSLLYSQQPSIIIHQPSEQQSVVVARTGKKQFVSQVKQPFSSHQNITNQAKQHSLKNRNKKDKFQIDQIKVKLKILGNIITELGYEDRIPEKLQKQLSSVDVHIKRLEQMLWSKRNKYFQKLKDKVRIFLKTMDFEINDEQFNKFEAQKHIIQLLLKLFALKYQFYQHENNKNDKRMQDLKKQFSLSYQKLQEEYNLLKIQNREMYAYIQQIQQRFKQRQSILHSIHRKQIQIHQKYQQNEISERNSVENQNSQYKMHKKQDLLKLNIQQLQSQNEQLCKKIKQLQNALRQKQLAKISIDKKYEQCMQKLKKQQNLTKQFQLQLQNAFKEQLKWKQRFIIMQASKNQRIQLLNSENTALMEKISQKKINSSNLRTQRSFNKKSSKKFQTRSFYKLTQMEESSDDYFDLNCDDQMERKISQNFQ